ncbi:hypothetical protein HIM_07780 [Hirsutella minnesotensis 3608]|uniref:Alkaline proteinase n=1 Tax=Hirsutella minnesotensis 3608 TaxID=1043627 RepID=A0A0F7ZHL2_9HYPO|nr:hypothetical protein HIM_07780 [Hirsutella minnesotensis 3608]
MVHSLYFAVLAAAFGVAVQAMPASVSQTESPVKGKYIVALKPGSNFDDLNTHLSWVDGVAKRGLSSAEVQGIEKVYSGPSDFHAYAGHFSEATIAEIRSSPHVALVEEDKLWELAVTGKLLLLSRPQRHTAKVSSDFKATVQQNSTWGLGAISHRQKGSMEYVYKNNSGEGTFAYVIDSGIRTTHDEFEGRAESAFSVYDTNEDDIGHGTHVAGTIGGKNFGVAKKTHLLAVKVFSGRYANMSAVLDGFNWAVNDIIAKNRTRSAVINMSLGGPFSAVFNVAVEKAAKSGVIMIVASGNSAENASGWSPASSPNAITVGAIDRDWRQAEYSNYGESVDILGPGSDVTSAGTQSDSESLSDTGTSMAAPHIAGLALNAISTEKITELAEVTKHLLKTATKGRIEGGLMGVSKM